jgi:hypothetical protein
MSANSYQAVDDGDQAMENDVYETDMLLRTQQFEELPETVRKPPERMMRSKRRYDVLVMLIIYLTWMFVGVIYYKRSDCCKHNWGESFYIAVNIGYSIGWSHQSEDANTHSIRYFSSVYLCIGDILILCAVTYFIDMIVERNTRQFADMRRSITRSMNIKQMMYGKADFGMDEYELFTSEINKGLGAGIGLDASGGNVVLPSASAATSGRESQASVGQDNSALSPMPSAIAFPVTWDEFWLLNFSEQVRVCYEYAASLVDVFVHNEALIFGALFFTWLAMGITWSQLSYDWSLSKSLYFSLSTLASAGLYSIPEDSTDLQFAFVGLYGATGIPITMLAIFNLVSTMIDRMGREKMTSYLHRKISDEDFEMLRSESIDPVTGKLDISKFLLLVFVRQRIVDMRLVDVVLERLRHNEELAQAKLYAETHTNILCQHILGHSHSHDSAHHGGGGGGQGQGQMRSHSQEMHF